MNEFLRTAWQDLPAPRWARWASLFFSLSVLTFLLSIAASQCLLALAGGCFAIHLVSARPSLRFPPVKAPLLLFSVLTIASVFGAADSAVGWAVVRKCVLFVIMLLAANLVASRKHMMLLYQGLFLESALAAVVAAGQLVWRYRFVREHYPDQIYYQMAFEQRVTGFMGHWMQFSGQQMLIFAALAAFLLLGRFRRPLWWGACGLVAASIVFGLTRGVWLGSFAASVYLLARWKPRWILVLPVLFLAGWFVAPSILRERVHNALNPSGDPALSIRLEMWQVGLRMIRTHPWLGVGPNNIIPEYPRYLPPGKSPIVGYHGHLHNNFLQLGAERGLPTLAAWLWFMVALAWHFWRERRSAGWMAEAALAAWLAVVVEGFFEFNFGSSSVLMLFLFLASVPAAAAGWKDGPAPAGVSATDSPQGPMAKG
ncbi:MAG: O-antigen ligase family protein [Acidobacteria bacterium]|nr:O-antigen ligase family protein [Acidobacteriota bacterium]